MTFSLADLSGASEYWNPKIQEDIYIKSQIGRYRICGYGGARALRHLADLAFRRDVSQAGKDADVVSNVVLEIEIGGLNGANPLKLSMPVMIAPMSYGALSASTKRAVGLASTLSGIAENTGEGGMSDAQRGAASQIIFQMLSGRLGWNIHDMNRADGLEIYISQSAKPGLGGQLMAKKVTPELARIRDTIAILRRLKKEEMIDIAYFGGARSGTDAAKLVGLGVNAIGYGVAVALALGGEITETGVRFAPDRNEEERTSAVVNILKANAGEASMMARCAGKTRLHNIEPEDLRSVIRATAAATGIPLTGTRAV